VRRNPALEKLRAGKVISGPMVIYDSPSLTEQIAHMGFDFTWLDWQHGQWSEHTLNDAIARFLPVESVPLVRVKGQEPGTINRVLDMGAMGVIVPYIQNADQARAAVQAAYYPPKGIRSGGGARLALLGDGENGSLDYYANANSAIMLGVMVETEEAISHIDEIMSVPGIDFVLIGPGDLMIDVTSRGGDATDHERLVLEVAAASKRTGTPAGYVTTSKAQSDQRVAQGFRFINYRSDSSILLPGMKAVLAETKDW
jgi:2-keto-3-deoxy-L-rhamnonate aldolase RhmA